MLPRLLALFLSLFLAFALPVAAQPQDVQAPNYDAWSKQADQAEQILDSGQANAARLKAIRAEVVKWREQFKSQDGVNATRIATLKDQIAALGPVPAEGQTEAPEVAARRKELNAQMAELQANLDEIKTHEKEARALLAKSRDTTARRRTTPVVA